MNTLPCRAVSIIGRSTEDLSSLEGKIGSALLPPYLACQLQTGLPRVHPTPHLHKGPS